MRKKKFYLFCLSLALTACTQKQHTSFYLLKSIDPVNQITDPNPSHHQTIVLLKTIKFPDYLDRPQMVLRENDYQFKFSEYHRWAEPLQEDFTRVLIENIHTRAPKANLLDYTELRGKKATHHLWIEVLQMDISTNNQAVLKVRWDLLPTDSERLMKKQTREYSLKIKDKSHKSGVKAQSKLIALFADQVAESIRLLNHSTNKHP